MAKKIKKAKKVFKCYNDYLKHYFPKLYKEKMETEEEIAKKHWKEVWGWIRKNIKDLKET